MKFQVIGAASILIAASGQGTVSGQSAPDIGTNSIVSVSGLSITSTLTYLGGPFAGAPPSLRQSEFSGGVL